ncbi:MAG: SDR family oxidoreductase [Streptosporangiales bacterium]|nr:SDR family oxidoreductase [Streptosporangiales bacterium]
MSQQPVAVVTGGGRNIGRSIALELARWGADVVVLVRANRAEAESVAAEVRAEGRRAQVAVADVRDRDAVAAAVADACTLGPPTILVNNAAIRVERPFLELTDTDWREVTSVIVDGAFVCAQQVLPHMLDAGHGRIVNIAGVTGQTGAAHRAHVVTAKAGLIGLTKALAAEYAADGVTVNAVSPGMIDTTRLHGTPQHHAGRTPPVGRLGNPQEIAAAVRYLVSPDAGYVTGQTINVNGGVLT